MSNTHGVLALEPMAVAGGCKLNKQKHINYWKRCLKTFLPRGYTSTDSNRMLLAFFIISACDLLGILHEQTTAQEREDYINWIYHCQHPDGGFRGFPGGDFGDQRSDENKLWDPANIPATYLALSALLILRDDLSRVDRKKCLQWYRKLQRPDGSFGETLSENDAVEGGMDSRFGYCAVVTRWILRGAVLGDVQGVPDINIDQLVVCIKQAQTYDGGISDSPYHEAHGGFTYCAIGILSFLRRLPAAVDGTGPEPDPGTSGVGDLDHLLRWLTLRQTEILEEEDQPDISGVHGDSQAASMEKEKHLAAYGLHPREVLEPPAKPLEVEWAGFTGRCNKIADTCYCFWVMGALGMLHAAHLADKGACRRYLLEKTQHMVGGFGKAHGDPPDIYHSYLGLAALALLDDESVKPIMPSACFSQDTAHYLESLAWRREITGEEDVGLPQGFAYGWKGFHDQTLR